MRGIFVYRRRRRPWLQWLLYTALVVALIWVFGDRWLCQKWSAYRRHFRHMPPPVQVLVGAGRAGKGRFYRFELIPVRVTLRDHNNRPIGGIQPLVQVFRGDLLLRDTAHRPKILLRYDAAADAWEGSWAMPLGIEPGPCRVRVRVSLPTDLIRSPPQEGQANPPPSSKANETTMLEVFSAPFEIAARQPQVWPQMAACDLEVAENISQTVFPRLDGRAGDWRNIFDWIDFIGCDTLFYQGPTTDAWAGPIDPENPWTPAQLSMITPLAREAHGRGLRFGVWIVAFRTHGRPENLAPYTIAAYDPSSQMGTISLMDERRPRDLARMVRALDENPDVDFIGFDYLRDALPSYDGVDRFVEELRPRVPGDWENRTSEQRQKWLRDTLAQWRHQRETWELWNWWRAHRVAEIVYQVLHEARPTKPVFAFTLGWRHGIEHGQDPYMLMDAGLSLDAVMLYQVHSPADFDWMIHDSQHGWEAYSAGDGPLSLAFGDQIDFFWHQEMLDPPAPREFRRRIREALAVGGIGNPPRGVFIHDLTRLLLPRGKRGPYPPLEWAAAAGAAVSDAKFRQGRLPISVQIQAPSRAPPGQSVAVSLILTNRSARPLRITAIDFPATPGLRAAGLTQPLAAEAVPAGQMLRIEAKATFANPPPGRAGYAMLGSRVTWEGAKPGDPPVAGAAAMDFVYVRLAGRGE